MQSMSTLMIQGRLYLYISAGSEGPGVPGGQRGHCPPSPTNILQLSYPYSNREEGRLSQLPAPC